jgi:hypothetical protein
VIPIYYVLGERLIDHFARNRDRDDTPPTAPHAVEHHGRHSISTHEPMEVL